MLEKSQKEKECVKLKFSITGNDYCFAQSLQFSMHNVISVIATSIMNKLRDKRAALPDLPTF